VTPEQVGFPAAAQAGQLYRKLGKHNPETVWVLTSRTAEQMNAAQWLHAIRAYWGIEAGLHQSLDASANEDRCRVRTRNAVWVLGMFRRLAISVFREWKARDAKRKWTTLPDFYTEMSVEAHRPGLRLVTARQLGLLRGAS
jgi:predicted transposase YbfD/YdcC